MCFLLDQVIPQRSQRSIEVCFKIGVMVDSYSRCRLSVYPETINEVLRTGRIEYGFQSMIVYVFLAYLESIG